MNVLENLSSLANEVKAATLSLFSLPTNGRATVLSEDLKSVAFPAREDLAVLVRANPNHAAFFAPIAPTGSGMGSMSFSMASAMTGQNIEPPPPFLIVTREEGKTSTTYVSEKYAREYSRVVAEMVLASNTGRLEGLPDLQVRS
jgi:hypothetical protein